MDGIIKTGISGLDAMLKGGIPEGNQIVLAGGPGAGKTLLSFEFLYRNAKSGIPSILFALDEQPDRIIKNAKLAFSNFKDIDELVGKGLLTVSKENISMNLEDGGSAYEFGKIVTDIELLINETAAKCIAIDAISMLSLLVKDAISYRRSMLALIYNLRRLGVVSLLTSELSNPERSKLKFSPEFFLSDGIMVMYQTGEEYKRMLALEIIKMRGSAHSFVTTPYEITPDGFLVTAAEDVAKLD